MSAVVGMLARMAQSTAWAKTRLSGAIAEGDRTDFPAKPGQFLFRLRTPSTKPYVA